MSRMPIDQHGLNNATLHRGYTMVEMVVVLVLAGILAAIVIPRFGSAMGARDDAWRDALVSGIRFAHKTALSHRRLVCAQVGATNLTLRIATSTTATSCDLDLVVPMGAAGVFATSSNSASGTSVSPAGTPSGMLYFHPDGRTTTDGAGTTVATRTISASGISNITVHGETGHVE